MSSVLPISYFYRLSSRLFCIHILHSYFVSPPPVVFSETIRKCWLKGWLMQWICRGIGTQRKFATTVVALLKENFTHVGIKSSQCLMKKKDFCCEILLRHDFPFSCGYCVLVERSCPQHALSIPPLSLRSPSSHLPLMIKMMGIHTKHIKIYNLYTWSYKGMTHLKKKSMLRANLMSTSHSSLFLIAGKSNLGRRWKITCFIF